MRSLAIAIPFTLAGLAALAGACSKNPEPAATQVSEAQVMYDTKCAICHGAGGAGNGPNAEQYTPRPHNYTDPAWQASITDDEIKRFIIKGGANLGKNPAMPSHTLLKDRPAVLDGLVQIIRGFGKQRQDGSAHGAPLTPRP